MKAAYLIVFLLFISCKSQKHYRDTDDRLVLLVQDGYFQVDNPETLIIKDAKSLRAFFSKVNQTRKPGIPVPEVDFKTQNVLVACMGVMETSYLPTMYLKNESPKEMLVSVRFKNESGKSGIKSFPFCVYAISHEGKKITLEVD